VYHFVYLTQNLINNMIYVGVHSSDSFEDSYLGSGFLLLPAIKKYGKDQFKRTILFIGRNEEEAYEFESWMVDNSFIKRKDTYNLVPGGRRPPNQKGKNNQKNM